MRLSVILASVASFSSSVQAAWDWGWCPWWWNKPVPVKNFDKNAYLGNWYELFRDKEVWYEQNVECVTATYTLNSANKWYTWFYDIEVRNRNMRNGAVRDPTFLSSGIPVSYARCDGNGNCNVKFWWYPEGDYVVLDTDYTSYALVYGCDNWGLFHTKQAWILSRTTTLPTATTDAIKQTLIDKTGGFYVPDAQWVATKQGGDCVYGI